MLVCCFGERASHATVLCLYFHTLRLVLSVICTENISLPTPFGAFLSVGCRGRNVGVCGWKSVDQGWANQGVEGGACFADIFARATADYIDQVCLTNQKMQKQSVRTKVLTPGLSGMLCANTGIWPAFYYFIQFCFFQLVLFGLFI